MGLVAGSLPNVLLDGNSVIVKPDAVKAQQEKEKGAEVIPGAYPVIEGTPGIEGSPTGGVAEKPPAILRRFHGSVDLDPDRMGRNAAQIAEEVLAHLAALVGARLHISLEIDAEVPKGIPENVIRTVGENARTLKFKTQDFEEE